MIEHQNIIECFGVIGQIAMAAGFKNEKKQEAECNVRLEPSQF